MLKGDHRPYKMNKYILNYLIRSTTKNKYDKDIYSLKQKCCLFFMHGNTA